MLSPTPSPMKEASCPLKVAQAFTPLVYRLQPPRLELLDEPRELLISHILVQHCIRIRVPNRCLRR